MAQEVRTRTKIDVSAFRKRTLEDKDSADKDNSDNKKRAKK